MTKKIIGKTTILCAAIVITITLVVTAWIVTSRSSKKKVDQFPIAYETQDKGNEIKEQSKADLEMDTIETDSTDIEVKREPAKDMDQQFEKIERDFVAGSNNVRELGDESVKQEKPIQEAVKTASDQPLTSSQEQEDSIDQVRLEAGKIVERSGLFSTDQTPEDAIRLSASDRDHGIPTEIPKNMETRRAIVSEQKAYQEAKGKVDDMLKSLGYMD